MLVLERKPGERLVLRVPGRSQPIVIEYIGDRHGRARIGLEAARDISISREEIESKLEYQKR